MDLIKDIEALSGKIEELKKNIDKYDAAFRSVDKHNIDKVFGGYKAAQAGAMSVDKLAQSVGVLSSQYGELVSAQEAAKNKMQQMTLAMTQMEQLQKTISAAQREALSSGDYTGATELYKQYVATGESMQLLRMEIESTGAEITAINGKMAEHTQTLERYKQVNDAAIGTKKNVNIADLTNKFEAEKNKIIEVSKSLEDYKIKYDATKAVVEKGGLVVGGLEKSKADLQIYADEISRLSNEYVIAAERAQQYANALGNDENGIPKVEMPKVEPEKVKQAADNMREYADNAGEAKDNLIEMVKQGAVFGGLTYGVHKLTEFTQQVMRTRGEFQQLEVAFSTMLGSKGKADALMQQLVRTAATTPFDLQSVSRGAKQLLAYGTAADEINDILIHLGDIAAGLSQPLDALVYLYGTTIVQGKMMTRDLRQFQNRGIPIAEQLAKQFGIAKSEVESYVSAGRVTADEFHKAIMGMASDGGKFAGLMSEQAKTITGQIRNIEDSIDIMFNEIGKSSEGVINFALSGVSKLVENYESVGRVIMGLVSAYGAYKAALIVCAAIEAARAKQATFSVAMGSKQVQMMNLLTKATWKQIAAQLKANAAAYANPYVAVAAALAAVVFVLINWNKWMDKAYDTAGKINRKYDESISKLNEEREAAEQHIAVLKDETATTYELAKAKDALNKIDLLKDVNIAGMTPEQIEEEIKKIYETRAKEEKKLQSEQHHKNLETGAEKYAKPKGRGAEESILNSMRESVKFITEENYEKYAEGKTDEEKLNALDKLIQKKVKEKEEWQKKLAEFNATPWLDRKNKNSGEIYEYYAAQAQAFIDNYEKQKETIKDGIKKADEKDKEDNTGNTLSQIIYGYKTKDKEGKDTFINGIIQQEQQIEKLRKKYAQNSSAANKKELESAEAGLKDLTDKYKLATGEQWVSTKEFTKAKEKEERDAARKSIDIAHQEYSKRVQLADKYNNDIKDLELEIAEWREKNKGRALPEYFSSKRAVIEAQFDFDKEQLDKEFNDWIEDIQRETIQINTEVEISELERAIDLADDYNTKLEKRKEINKKQIAAKNAELDLEKEQTAESQFGEQTVKDFATYNKETGKYINADGKEVAATDDEKVVFAQLERFYTEFENKRNAIIGQMKQEDANEKFNEDLQRFEEYVQGMLDAEQQYQEELARIREENGLKADTDIENNQDAGIQAQVQKAKDQRDTAQKIIKRDTGITDDTWVTELGELGAKVAGKAYDEVKKLYDEFIQSVNDDIAEVEAQKVAAENIASGGDAKTLKEEAETQLGVVETQLLDPNLSKEKKVELLQQELELKAQIAYYDAVEQGNAESLNSLTERGAQLVNVRNRAEKDAANAQQKADTKTLTRQQKIAVSNKAVVDGLTSVRDMANAVANTFGGALSKKSKKALTAMTLVADFGIDAVKGIETIVNGVSNGMIKTTEGASKSMQALEKASFILTVISLAVQLIMKIAEIASQFTKSAQLQNSIDDHLAKVDELKKQQQMIEAQYATSQGSDYYKGLAKSAEAYDAIIKENKAALADAEELYQHNLSKYGEDSEKTEEAKAQRDDLALQDQEFQNSQIEAWRGLMEELSGTSLDSFAENLADALIEGFAMGKDGIDDVWGDTMDDLLRTMMRNQLAIALKDQFEDAFTSLENATKEDGVLSDAEMQEFMNNLEAGKEKAEQIAGAYYDAMSEAGLLDDADAEGSQGFGQMTQDQADTLTARFTAVQIEMANVSATTQAMAGVVSLVGEDIKLGVAGIQSLLYNSNIALQMAQDQLDQMQIIADNTAMLAETNTRLKAIEQNTGRL